MSARQEPGVPLEIDAVTARYHHLLIRSQPGLEIVINAMPKCYLGGTVSCTSNPDDGTVFAIRLPITSR